ncbi:MULTISPECIES: SGNH/GDSL hydrolase family protein [Galbibacter]|uniref:Lysophospholipase L1-like esterase n=1 Tax=Galbibacter marinus TaxID=555500 RepID=K2P369_9FLAO|nr:MULTISPECIES: SGNH/GDSL hydrolase family protein [Galbibacter]EKF55498.1 lysophospholipase L1-like esterase [Galbibacter marinus]HLV64065.1 SGNH/GDSL hydrolase family protein [Galbibacter sp.]
MRKIVFIIGVVALFVGCKGAAVGGGQGASDLERQTVKYLALGDSYTQGENVCESCSFPMQLMERIAKEEKVKVKTEVVAQTGWTSADLISGLRLKQLGSDYDLVTLLIGVNNQYQNKDIASYELDLSSLLLRAVQYAGGDKNKVILISIPDYAYTPEGQSSPDPSSISSAINQYNEVARKLAAANGITFVNITDISRQGLANTDLVAEDQLHPSATAYSSFVSEILFEIKKKQLF